MQLFHLIKVFYRFFQTSPKPLFSAGFSDVMARMLPVWSATLSLFLTLLLTPSSTLSAATGSVSDVRLGAHPSYTRIVLDLSILPEYEIFSLTAPNRLIIDLPEVSWNLTHKNRQSGLVSAVRYGLYHKGRSRIVLDVNRPSKIRQAFTIPATGRKPNRLVIDIAKTNATQFQASLNKTLAASGNLPQLPTKRTIVRRQSQQGTQIAQALPKAPVSTSPVATTRPSAPALPASHPLSLQTSRPNQIQDQAQGNQPLRFVSQAQAATAKKPQIPDLDEPFQQVLKQQIASLPQNLKPAVPSPQPASRKTVVPKPVPRPITQPTPQPVAKPSPPPLQRRNMPVIVIDPGHGGIDPGASGAKGTREKHITLQMGLQLQKMLQNTGKYRVHLTRTKDEFIRLRNRFHMAEEWGAHLFISLHADSVEHGYPRGASIYTLSEDSSDREAADLAKSENKVDLLEGINLEDQDIGVQPILIDLQRRKTMELSNDFAENVVASLRKNKVRTLKNAHRSAGFAVLKSPNIPSILIEMGFLSSPKEEWLLKQKSHRERIGKALVLAINQYFFHGVGAKLLLEN